MSAVTIETILTQVNQLPAAERAKLIVALADKSEPQVNIPPAKRVKPRFASKERTREYAWLKTHRREYTGQWIALEGDQLIAHSPNVKEVLAKVTTLAIDRPLVLLVEDAEITLAGL